MLAIVLGVFTRGGVRVAWTGHHDRCGPVMCARCLGGFIATSGLSRVERAFYHDVEYALQLLLHCG